MNHSLSLSPVSGVRIAQIVRATEELNRCVNERGKGSFLATLGELDWLTELHRLLYEEDEVVRVFDTGATRDTDDEKLDFEGFLSPLALERYAEYMHSNRKMGDGARRASDNWQKGIPMDAYLKSAWRHFFAVWKARRVGRGLVAAQEDMCALLFNIMGLLHEVLKQQKCLGVAEDSLVPAGSNLRERLKWANMPSSHSPEPSKS